MLNDMVGGVSGCKRVGEGLLVTLAYPAGKELIVQSRLQVEEGCQQQGLPYPASKAKPEGHDPQLPAQLP